jgi:hypothetical protein
MSKKEHPFLQDFLILIIAQLEVKEEMSILTVNLEKALILL